jgi:hypothetical protein
MEKTHEVIPSARRLIRSLRDIGYDFSTAVADLIDNSIEAGASRVDILVDFHGENSCVRISDNGKGMDGEELKEAMRYGSERTYSDEDLGKFGLGLKTASMSQCRCFSVASRSLKSKRNIISLSWDLDHIEKTNKWEIFSPEKREVINILHEPLMNHTGTVVLWERLDRILNFEDLDEAESKLKFLCRELEYHLSMVFHKFLSGEVPKKKLEIFLNENKIQPWDPFARSEPKTKKLSAIKINITNKGVQSELILQPYILPTKDEFTSFLAFNNAAGPANWNHQQGFYIYRSNRMIQSGGWCGLRTRDEHTKLSRIELNFPPKLDNAFKVNVAKMRVQLPIQIKGPVGIAISPPVRLARDYYDRKMGNETKGITSSKNSQPSPSPGNNVSKTQKLFTIDEIAQRADEVATGKEKEVIKKVFRRLRKLLDK